MKFSDSVYKAVKFVAQIALPAVGTLYVALAALWDLPNPDKVSGTILAVDTFLGVLLGISTANYNSEQARIAAEGGQAGPPGV